MGTNTGIGIGIGIPFKNNALGGDRPYLPPELKARLIGVWDNYGKKNTDADRNIIKNKIPNAGGDLEILNAAYKLNSGFGEYKEDFTSWRIYPNIEVTDNVITTNGNFNSTWFIYKYANENEINEMNIKVSGIPEGGIIRYFYIPDETATIPVSYNIPEDGVYHLPKSKLSSNRVSIGFTVSSSYDWNNIRIEQLSDFGGAFVTDGVNDMIISQKTLQEMGVTKDFTVVSMIHQISWRGSGSVPLTNYIRPTDNIYVRNQVADIGKTGIYGYVIYDVNNTSVNNSRIINTVLGDKNDYSIYTVGNLSQGKFSVQGYIDGNDNIREISSVAHYWTFALLGKATEDDINLIIAYFNLDRTLKPDIRCNIERQGITNDNHADFNDRLIDYSGNGRDIQMYNLAWKGGSGIAAKPFETIKDYTIVSDEARQKLTIYNEFSYKIKSNTPSYYWTVQSIIRDNTSYQVTIITDKDCYWINATSFINSEGNKESIRKRYPVLANTPTQVIICGLDQFEYPEGIEPTNAVSYVNLEYAGEITITFIPSHKGGLLLDGVNDFGKVTGMPIYKDYTVIADYERFYLEPITGGRASILSKSSKVGDGSFIFNLESQDGGKACYTFGEANGNISDDITRIIRYQSKYYNTKTLSIGTAEDNDFMVLGKVREVDSRYFCGAIYSLMSFPYSMSEFLIERQLKKYKLGTLYPNMVEFRPVIKANANYKITYYQIDSTNTWKSIKVGDYIVIGAKLAFQITFDNDASELKEVVSPQLSGIIVEKIPSNPGYNIYSYITSKSPQKINITIDEYIRFEDIVQPYPSLFTLIDYDTEEVYSWGSKLKVGARFKGDVVNLLPNMYEWQGNVLYNGEVLNWGIKPGVVAKEMVFSWNMPFKYLIDNNEPKVILSPRLLRIPNSSYKILGYIPDISGHGNHGVIHNSVYAKGSGVNEDGSYQFDGVNDFVTIPTLFSGGKQVLMKVNWDKTIADAILYDQRGYPNEFAIYNADVDNNNPVFAYQARNNGQTYIDGILNKNIKASELRAITHNITITNELSTGTNTSSPVIGSNRVHDAYFTNMALYDFMLFDEISTEDKIKELNEYVGIEAKVELPPYYWDAYGKTNLDGDKATIQQRGVAVGDYDLTNNNLAYEGMSGYNGYPVVFGTNKTYANLVPNNGNFILTSSHNIINVTKFDTSYGLLYSHIKLDGKLTSRNIDYPSYKIKVTGLGENFGLHYSYLESSSDTTVKGFEINNDGIYIIPKSFASDGSLTSNSDWIGFIFTGTAPESCNVTIEMLPLYPNGLVYDGITDYSMNTNIPALTDYTYILKRQILKGIANSAVMYKGNVTVNRGGAFICNYCEPSDTNLFADLSFGGLLRSNDIDKPIIYGTKTSVNGDSITPGENIDTVGINVGKWVNYLPMVFYKLILYPKTIPLLQINFLKNLMERDEIIDINHPIFISNTEDKSNTSQDT
nr:MAG TPA: hypothetical protein [Crassvirales sp.]